MKKALSIKDIAARAGVSITTVSFILNGKAKEKAISDAVIKKVEKIISELGYKPSWLARSLRSGNSYLIGLIVEDISNPFFAGIAKLIEHKAYQKGYKIIYASTENKVEKTRDLIEMFKSRKVDAYIISPVKDLKSDITALINEQKTVVLFDRNPDQLEVDYVGVDHLKASAEATESLVKSGKKNIALVTIDLDIAQITDRLNGYSTVLQNHNLYNDKLVLKIPFEETAAESAAKMRKLFATPGLDAVLFATNYLAINGLMVLKELNKEINADFNVIAYDDHVAFQLFTPPVSAVEQPLEEIAEKIINLVLSGLSAKEKQLAQELILPARLILRN